MKKLSLACVFFLAVLGCQSRNTAEENNAQLSAITLAAPAVPGLSYSSYYFSIKPEGAEGKCSAFYDVLNDKSKTSISHTVKMGCDYTIVLELGNVDPANSKSLSKVFYTNRLNGKAGDLIKASQLTPNQTNVSITLYKKDDSGVQTPPSVTTPGETNISISVVIDGEKEPNEPAEIAPLNQNDATKEKEVHFSIPENRSQTGGNWNTPETKVVLKLGQKLVLINTDSQSTHRLHTDNQRPFPHGIKYLKKGESETFTPTQAFNSGFLHDHDHPEQKFYFEVLP